MVTKSFWKLLAASCALVAFVPAQAQMRHRGGFEQRGDGDRGSFLMPPQQAQQELAPRQDPPSPGRMSPEERRQLRRDIHDAGRELYGRNPRHGAPP
jgi:hypothetical protein